MPTIEVSTYVEANPEAIVEVLLDSHLAPAWTSGLDRLELVDGAPGQAGCVGRAHYTEGRRSYTLDDVLEQAVPNRYYRSKVTGGGLTATVETTLEPVGDTETDLTLRWTGTGTSPLTRVVLPLMKRRIAERAKTDLEALRRLAEDRNQRRHGAGS